MMCCLFAQACVLSNAETPTPTHIHIRTHLRSGLFVSVCVFSAKFGRKKAQLDELAPRRTEDEARVCDRCGSLALQKSAGRIVEAFSTESPTNIHGAARAEPRGSVTCCFGMFWYL